MIVAADPKTDCAQCGAPILAHETPVPTEQGPVHEHCADAEDAMAAGVWRPGEDFPHGDF